jgi:hypothetical protein
VRDDLTLHNPDENWDPAPGIAAFLSAINGQYEVVNQTEQHLLIKKNA